MSRAFLVTGALLLAPLVLFAQEDALRAQIRADLQNDPRAASLSSEEFEELVSVIAMQAETEGTAAEYLEAGQNTFDYGPLFAAEEPQAETNTSAILIALLSLASMLAVVVIHTIRHRGMRPDEPSDLAA